MRWAILSLAAAAALTLSAGDASAQWRGHGGYHANYNHGGYGGYRYNYPRYNYSYGYPRYYSNYGYGYRPGVSLYLGGLGLGLGSGYYSPWGNNYGWGNGYNPYYGSSWYW